MHTDHEGSPAPAYAQRLIRVGGSLYQYNGEAHQPHQHEFLVYHLYHPVVHLVFSDEVLHQADADVEQNDEYHAADEGDAGDLVVQLSHIAECEPHDG